MAQVADEVEEELVVLGGLEAERLANRVGDGGVGTGRSQVRHEGAT